MKELTKGIQKAKKAEREAMAMYQLTANGFKVEIIGNGPFLTAKATKTIKGHAVMESVCGSVCDRWGAFGYVDILQMLAGAVEDRMDEMKKEENNE